MAIVASSRRRPALKNTHIPADSDPEYALGLAIVRQARADLRHPQPHIRAEALRWWADRATLQFWDDLLSLGGRLMRHVAAL